MAQTETDMAPPQVTVTVTEHPTSAEMVEVTALRPDYPADLLRSQAEAVGRNAGSESRGVTVFKSGPNERIRFLKARFATDNLIDRKESVLWLEPIVKAFLGAPEPYTVTSLMVTFDGEKPVPGKTLQDFASRGVELTAHSFEAPRAVEYRIALLSQDPSQVSIPRAHEGKMAREPSAAVTSGPEPVVIALLALAGLAGGALVYFLVSAKHGRRRSGGA
jgi:hypothetical protein